MFKRNLLKRTLPILLSVAMTFQSVPITAMAAEGSPAAVVTEVDEPEPAAGTSEETVVEAAEEVAAETPEESVVEQPADSEQPAEDVSEGDSGEESAPEESADVVSGSETNDQENTGSEIEAEISEETKTGTDGESETNQAESETAAVAGAEKAAEEAKTTEINLDKLNLSNFTLQREKEDITYTTEYSTSDKFGSVVSDIKKAARIYVNGEYKINAESYLDTQWEKKDANEAWASISGRPEAVGSYRLKLSLKQQEEGLWLACDTYVYFNITKQELTLNLKGANKDVQAGSKIKDFTDRVLEKAEVQTEDGETPFENGASYKLEVTVYKNGEMTEAGEKKPTTDTYFSKAVDYHFTVKVTWDPSIDASMKENYTVDCNGKEGLDKEELKEYPIHFKGVRKTKVEVAQPSKEIAKTYGKDGTEWSIEDIEKELEKLGVTTKEVMVEAADEDESGAKQDKDGDWWVPLEKMNEADTVEVTPLWCIKENNKDASAGSEYFFTEDEINKDTQFLKNEKKDEDGEGTGEYKDLYTILVGDDGEAETKVDKVGEYYLVYMYPGTVGAFEESYSEPIKVTIDPWPVILKPAKSVENLVFNTSMTSEDVARVLAKVETEFIDADPAANRAVVEVKDEDGFYGVSYDSQDKVQYYNPVFELMYTETPKTSDDAAANPPKEGLLQKVKYEYDYERGESYLKLNASEKNTYKYYIVFTGQKAVSVYKNGRWTIDTPISVAEATDAADPNYRILADYDTINDVANAVEVKVNGADKAKVDVDPIIAAFTGQHPQAGTGDIGKGLLTPASMIYNPEIGLFKERADYKAAVAKVDNDAGTAIIGSDDKPVEKSHKDLTYTWEKGSLAGYYDLIHSPRADEKNEDHEAWKAELENFTFGDRVSGIPQDAGIYRLHVRYTDGSLAPTYAPSDGYAYFLIEKQQIVFKANDQYAEYEDSVYNFSKEGYSLYKIPENDGTGIEEKIDAGTAEELKYSADVLFYGYYGDENADWHAVNKAKKTDGTDKNPVEWTESVGQFQNLAAPYSYDYRAAIWFDDNWDNRDWEDGSEDEEWEYYNNYYFIREKDDEDKYVTVAGKKIHWKNYTTRYWDPDAKDGKGDWAHRFIVGPEDVNAATYARILFVNRTQVIVSADENPFKDKVYDGKPIDSTPAGVKLADLIKLEDEKGNAIDKSLLSVSESLDAEGAVKVGWYWDEGYKVVPTSEAIYGGTYYLCAFFEGNTAYKEIEDWDWVWKYVYDKDDKPISFEIKPFEVEITPNLIKTPATAGEPLSSMLGDEDVDVKPISADKLPEGDELLFKRGARWVESVVEDVRSINTTTGYPILGDEDFGPVEYYADNIEQTSDELIRFGKKYDVKFSGSYSLFAQYDSSYKLTFKSTRFENIDRGDAKVGATNFYVEGENKDDDNGEGVGRAVEDEGRKGYVSVYTEKTDESYVIKPQEGIPFVYEKLYNIDTKLMRYDTEEYSWFGGKAWSEIDSELKKQLPLDKNYIAVNILSPREFSRELYKNGSATTFAEDNFVYKNSIEANGGYVIAEGLVRDPRENGISGGPDYRYAITALFPVEFTDENGKIEIIDAEKPFEITWEKGYTEAFMLDLKDAKLEANLKKAVAPKSLAFNGVVTKMAIGEEQQLDVKITKAQLGDVIQIRYRLENRETDEIKTSNEYASINPETGLITALAIEKGKKNSAVTVEAYPVRLSADGKRYEEITGKGAKPAKTKITINEVSAPAIKKIVSKDTSAQVQYTKVGDGYRREIYVKSEADIKAAARLKKDDFDKDIKAMKNGQWKEYFAIAPIYVYGDGEYDTALKLCKKNLESLEAGGKAYAVYVRNVSAVRTLADGSRVTESIAGSVKTFATTKSMVQRLDPYFVVEETKTPANPIYITDGDYTVDLKDKSAQLLVRGTFSEKAYNPAADSRDKKVWELPLKKNADYRTEKEMYGAYLEPKLSYYITDCVNPDFDAKGKLLNPSKYATISNSGKIALKGVRENGAVTVELWVFADKAKDSLWESCTHNSCYLTICAKPDTVTPKRVKPLKVGDSIRLADYLDYREGNTKLPNYWSSNIVIQNKAEFEDQGFKISYNDEDGHIITAVKPKVVRPTVDLEFTDVLWKTDENGKVTSFTSDVQKLALSTSSLDPVKGLKAVYTDDKHITLNFTHAGHPEAFVIELTDARGSVIFKKMISSEADIVSIDEVEGLHDYKDKGPKPWLMNEQKGIVGILDGKHGGQLKYFEKTKTYAYTIYTEKLMRLSSYNISVDTVYNGVSVSDFTKVASTKAKTTNIPASYGDASTTNPAGNYYNPYEETEGFEERFKYDAGGKLGTYLESGNTYTVQLDVQNGLANTRGTDTLTWKSSNAKVLSVKPNQGSYTATVKALQQGKATITVASKVTKKTIGRWYVAVKAVGNGSTFGGDFEWSNDVHTHFYDDFIKTYDPYYEGRVEVLTVSNPVHVGTEDFPGYDENNYNGYKGYNDYTWVQFTAPAYGDYSFKGSNFVKGSHDANGEPDKSGRKNIEYYVGNRSKKQGTFEEELNNLRLEKGQKVYFRVYGPFTLEVASSTDFTKFTVDDYSEEKPFKPYENMWVSFTATEENYYTFVSKNGTCKFEQNGETATIENDSSSDSNYKYIGSKYLKAGETLFIYVTKGDSFYVTKRVFEKELANGDNALPFTKNDKLEEQCKYFTFKPSIAGDYVFTYAKENAAVDVQLLPMDSNDPYANEDVVILATPYADEGTGTEPAPKPEPVKWNLFIEKEKTVVVKVTVPKSAFEKTENISVNINVGNTNVKPLENGAPVTKKTSQTFEYTILPVEKETTYTITAGYTPENATEAVPVYISWCKAVGGEQFDLVSGITYTVKDGKIEGDLEGLKVGDKIYIKVDATELEYDVKVSIETKSPKEPFDLTKSPVKLTLPDDADSYTFVVRKTGYYEFTAAVDGEQPKHNLKVTNTDLGLDISSVKDGKNKDMVKLTPGSYKLTVESVSNGAGKDDKTAATISVKEITAEKLIVGPNGISVDKDGVKYYFFKADAEGSYNITWTPDEGADKGKTTVEYLPVSDEYGNTVADNMAADADYEPLSSSKKDSEIRYIKVSNTSEKAASGTLQVDANVEKGETLTSKNAKTVDFTKDGSKTFTFTTPDESELGYTVIVENTITVPEGKAAPKIEVTGDDNIKLSGQKTGKLSQDMITWTKPYATKSIKVEASGIAEGVTATVKITINPITPEASNGQISAVKILEGDSKWYSISITDAGRYSVSEKAGENQSIDDCNVAWYVNEPTYDWYPNYVNEYISKYTLTDDTVYLNRGKKLYVNLKAKGSIKAEGIDATVALAKIEAGTITLGEDGKGTVELTETTPDYYTFTAPGTGTANYTVKGGSAKLFEPVYNKKKGELDDTWESGSELKGGKTILIKVGKTGTLTVEKSNMLTAGATTSPVTLAAGETATFVFKPFVKGYYDFTVSEKEKLDFVSFGGYGNIYTGDIKGYKVINVSSNPRESNQCSFTVQNMDEAAPVTFTVTTKAINPVALKLDTAVSLEKDRLNVLEFAVPETYRYTFTCAGCKLTDKDGKPVKELLNKSTGDEKEIILAECTGTEAGTVSVSKVALTPATLGETTVALNANDVKWYSYKAENTGECTITVDGASYSLYESFISSSTSDSPLTVKAGSTIYIKVQTVAAVEAAKLTVKLEAMDELKLEGKDISIDSGKKDMAFQATADGFYKFKFVNADEADTSTPEITYYGGTYLGKGSEVSEEAEYYVTNGDVVFLSVAGKCNGKITVTKSDMPASTELTRGSWEGQKLDDENWYTFTANVKDTYYVDMKNNDSGLTPEIYQSGKAKATSSWSVKLDAGEKIYIKVSGTSAGKYEIRVKKSGDQ